jgi:hypothetical protein
LAGHLVSYSEIEMKRCFTTSDAVVLPLEGNVNVFVMRQPLRPGVRGGIARPRRRVSAVLALEVSSSWSPADS